ncbi:hypothetical protein [Devosia ginsengisoli]|nr:hypothetical protein [Devosia ginsengisoli]MCR6673215.1 hypothetical protein [Devosia ginsengisoli]
MLPPAIALGQSPKALAGQCLVALDGANGRITDFGAWYEALRTNYGTIE